MTTPDSRVLSFSAFQSNSHYSFVDSSVDYCLLFESVTRNVTMLHCQKQESAQPSIWQDRSEQLAGFPFRLLPLTSTPSYATPHITIKTPPACLSFFAIPLATVLGLSLNPILEDSLFHPSSIFLPAKPHCTQPYISSFNRREYVAGTYLPSLPRWNINLAVNQNCRRSTFSQNYPKVLLGIAYIYRVYIQDSP